MQDLKRYIITIEDQETDEKFHFDFENMSIKHDLGVLFTFRKNSRGNHERLELRAWSNCENFEDYQSLKYEGSVDES